MARIDFYKISPATPQGKFNFICRLIEKAYLQKHSVLIKMTNESEALELNELLWTFKEDSFIPHHICKKEHEAPILICLRNCTQIKHTVLLNLTQEPSQEAYDRLLEVIMPSEQAVCESKINVYKQLGFSPIIHDLTTKELSNG